MIATRLAPAACVALALALVPTVIHSYVGVRDDDGVRAAAMPASLAGMTSRATDRSPRWGTRHFGTDDWIERWYGPSDDLSLFVARGDDAKALYHHPELAISYPEASLGRATVETLPGRPDVPVFVLRGIEGRPDMVAYVLRSRGAYISSPVLWQVSQSLLLLVSGRAPLTLIYVHDRKAGVAPISEQSSARVLRSAVEAFESLERGR